MFGPNKLLVALEDDDALAVWDTKTRLLTSVFDVDLDGGVPDRAPHDMHIAPGPGGELYVYYTQLTGHRLGRLNARTREVVEFPTLALPALPGSSTDFVMEVLPNAPSMFHLIHHEETNSIWFALQQQARVGRFDIATETITEYSLGIPPGRGPLVLHEAADGAIWVSTVSLVPTVPGGLIRIDPDRAEAALHPVVVGADPGEEPRVRVLDSVTGQEWLSFLAFDPTFDGGVTVMLEDVTMNGTPEIIATSGGVTRVFDLATGSAHGDLDPGPDPLPVLFGPSPYFSADDTPDGFLPLTCGQCVRLEDFEDGSLGFGLTISTGMIIDPDFSSGITDLTDSVDGDDGAIDGTGQTGDGGYSWFAQGNSVLITLPGIAQSAGVVWTDGDPRLTDVVFEAFDQDGSSLGQINAGDIADDSIQGTTDEDRFFGIRFGDGMLTGVTAIRISNVGPSGIEIDHIQFANCAACDECGLRF